MTSKQCEPLSVEDPQDLEAALVRVFPSLNANERRISLNLYRLLTGGGPVSLDVLAESVDLPPDAVSSVLDRWPGVYRNDGGEVVGYWGLTPQVETNHKFELEGRRFYTWCAWDSLFIPELLNQTARVESTCPVSGTAIRLVVSPRGIEDVMPAAAVMSFVAPEEDRIQEDVVGSFCHYVHFFASEYAGKEWVAAHAGTALMSLERAFHLGRLKNQHQYPDLLESR